MDAAVSLFLQNSLRCPVLNFLMIVITHLGDKGAIWLVTAVVLMIFPRTRRAGFGLIAIVGLCWLVNNQILKRLVDRPRPCYVVEGLTALVSHSDSSSFPSGHACAGFACAYFLARSFPKKGGPWAYAPAAVIAFSRVYVGVHYLTDVLAGALVGTLGSILFFWLYPKVMDRLWPKGKHEK